MTDDLDLDRAADELYGGDPAAFVARRTELVKRARAAKDRPLAASIGALRRPTLGAWYVNLAARSGLASLGDLLDLGGELRQATAALDFRRVVALGGERSRLERAVLGDLTRLLAARGLDAGPAALEEVRSTLRAALADPDAAAAVASGRLDRPLQAGAFDIAEGLGGAAALTAPQGPGAGAAAGSPPGRGPKSPQIAPGRADGPAAAGTAGALAETGTSDTEATESGATEAAAVAEAEAQRARDEARAARIAQAQDEAARARAAAEESRRRRDELAASLEHAEAALADARRARDNLAGSVADADRRLAEAIDASAAADEAARAAEGDPR